MYRVSTSNLYSTSLDKSFQTFEAAERHAERKAKETLQNINIFLVEGNWQKLICTCFKP